MNICVPVLNDNGLDSPICEHFGSAPIFMLVDTDSKECKAVPNSNQSHQHSMCQPVAAISGLNIDGILVGGIGVGALNKLAASGYKVFQAHSGTVKNAVDAYNSGNLNQFTAQNACGGGRHGSGQGCGG